MKTFKLSILTICVALSFACHDHNGGGVTNNATVTVVTAIGGTGSNGNGGAGGAVYVDSEGAIKVLKSGSACASFAMPAESSYVLGANGYTVSGSESIILSTAAPAGYTGLYVTGGSYYLYKADGSDNTGGLPVAQYTVTGLRVPTGATLTIAADNNWYGGEGYLGAYLTFANDVVIDGTLKTGTGFNFIYFDNSSSSSGGSDVKGTMTPADGSSPLNSNNIVVTGTVTTSGSDQGWIEFDAGRHFYNSGTLDASGADNATGAGHQSEGIYLYAYAGSVYSSGTLKANGGNSGDGVGGAANDIELVGGYNGDNSVDPINGGSVILSGTLESKGGNGGGTTGGNGGPSGWIGTYAYGGDTFVNASFDASGGSAAGTGNTGGTSDGVEFYCYGEDYRRVGVCQISGSFNVNGGNGENGGDAGYVEVDSYSEGSAGLSPDVELLGFANINVSGGNGTAKGGNASDWSYELLTYAPYDEYDRYYISACPIISEANVTAKGGNASAAGGVGGNGGYVELSTDYYDDYSTLITMVTQSGTIDVSGGDAMASGGTGGNASRGIYLGDYEDGYCWHVTTTGMLVAQGGNGVAQGGNGGYIDMYSENVATVYTPTNLSVSGGTATIPGNAGSTSVD